MHVRQNVKITNPDQIVGRVIGADNLALNLNASGIGFDAAKAAGKTPGAASGLATLGATSIVVQQPPSIAASKVTSGRFGMVRLPDMALDKIPVGQGAGNSPVEEDKPENVEGIQASDDLRNSNDTVRTTQNSTYEKRKQVLLNADLPACRISFAIQNDNTTTYGRIYKNGAPIGLERQKTGMGYTAFSEDFTGFVSGNLIQIYIRTDNPSYKAWVKDFHFSYKGYLTYLGDYELTVPLETEHDPTISMTNQDP